MRGAADRCQRIGACRKTGLGVMCPSYMATREEEHATRGRANALVKALSSARPEGRAGRRAPARDPRPLPGVQGVQERVPAVASTWRAMKTEFLSHYQDIHGVPLRSRLFGAIRALNRLGAATAPLSNLPGRVPPLRALLERTAGIARRRPLPRFARETLVRWHRRRPRAGAARAADRGRARVPRRLLHDLHRAGDRPRGDRAARGGRLARAAGERRLLRAREHLQGPARPGARHGRRPGRAARPEAERGVPIVGCEPSCLLTLREEHLSLLPGDPRAQAVGGPGPAGGGAARRGDRRRRAAPRPGLAGQRAADRLPRPLPPEGARRHGGDRRAAASASRAPRWSSSTPAAAAWPARSASRPSTTTCRCRSGSRACSRRCAARPPSTLVAATGVSCRQQIAHGAGREARHPVELVRAAL